MSFILCASTVIFELEINCDWYVGPLEFDGGSLDTDMLHLSLGFFSCLVRSLIPRNGEDKLSFFELDDEVSGLVMFFVMVVNSPKVSVNVVHSFLFLKISKARQHK